MSGSAAMIENSPSFLGNLQTRLRSRTLLFRYLVIVNLIFGAWYLHWRITASINWAAFWIAIPLFLAEAYSYLGGILFLIGLWRPLERRVKSIQQMTPPLEAKDLPTVDVFIACYNEPVEIVETTARAALAIDYPATKLTVYILDDGNSPAMRAMTERLSLEDLQSPLLQQEADRLNRQRLALTHQLKELQILEPEIQKAETFLASFHLQVESRSKALHQALAWFETCHSPTIPRETWLALQTALGEGLDNAIAHAHEHLPPETPIDLHITIFSHFLQLRIWDQGPGFDLETCLRDLPERIDQAAESGRGLTILSKIADELSYLPTSDRRNCLLINKTYKPLTLNSAAQGDSVQAVFNEAFNSKKGSTDSKLSPSSPDLLGYLQGLDQLFWLQNKEQNYESRTLTDQIQAEQKKLQKAIYQQEQALGTLARCRYIARPKPKDRPHYAKAGNINYAIFSGETSGEFIVTLDADHIPKPQFLQRVLPYFLTYNIHTGKYENNQIAFVQTPQAFYNLPQGDPFGHEAHLFYGPIQQGKDGMNAAFYTGTNAILRREALVSMGLQNFAEEFMENERRLEEFELIGGVSSLSITEDMNTAMRLHAAGWQSAYHNEVLAEGLAPDDLQSTLTQKLRWAQGTIQVLLRDNPLMKQGLSFWQQWQYFQTMYSYFSGFFIAIFIACPILYFFTGIIPVNAFGSEFAIHFIPTYLLNRLTFLAAAWGVPAQELWRSEQYAVGLFPLQIQAVWSVFMNRPIRFKVTPKQRQSGIYLGLVWPQIVCAVLTLLGILWCIYRYAIGQLADPMLSVINTSWSLYNLALLWGIIHAAIWRPRSS
jgi:cellulose synthase (UDP-forming)